MVTDPIRDVTRMGQCDQMFVGNMLGNEDQRLYTRNWTSPVAPLAATGKRYITRSRIFYLQSRRNVGSRLWTTASARCWNPSVPNRSIMLSVWQYSAPA